MLFATWRISILLERFDEAKPLLARYIELEQQANTPLIAAVSTLGELERQSQNYDSSIQYDERAIALDPDNDSQVHIMANTYNNIGRADLAIRIYRAGIAATPKMHFLIAAWAESLSKKAMSKKR